MLVDAYRAMPWCIEGLCDPKTQDPLLAWRVPKPGSFRKYGVPYFWGSHNEDPTNLLFGVLY